jgi:nitrate/nitrite transport system substrate-binding protein
MQAAALLVEEGKARKTDFPAGTDGYRPPTKDFIDGVEYDGRKPNAYLERFAIGLKGNQRVSGGTSTH